MECQARRSEQVATVIELEWEPPFSGTSWVEFGPDEQRQLRTPASSQASALLLGLPPFSDAHYRVVHESGDQRTECSGQTETLGLPSELPELQAATYDIQARSPETWLLGATMSTPCLFGLDREGDWAWYLQFDEGQGPDVQFAQSGEGLLHNLFDVDRDSGQGRIRHVDLSGVVQQSLETEQAHHMFAQLPEGVLAFLVTDLRQDQYSDPETGELQAVVGDAIVEATADGELTTVFSTWDWLVPNEIVERWPGFYDEGLDWVHANALKYDEQSDSYLVALGNLDMVMELDRSTGTPLRVFGGSDEDLADPALCPRYEADGPFHFPHDPSLTDDGHLLLFATDEDSEASLAVEYALDETAGRLELVAEYGRSAGLATAFLGQATRLKNGNTMVSWGSAGLLREYTPQGELVWELSASAGTVLGQVRLFEDWYAP